MAVLIGSSGFIGGILSHEHHFTHRVNRSTIPAIRGIKTDLLVCAGLPAAKWHANQFPADDWANVCALAANLELVIASAAVLISTVDVYQPPVAVNELKAPDLHGDQPYGRNRGWFEVFFRWRFPASLVIRLPGLYAPGIRKNLVHDLLHGKSDQLQRVHRDSTFQFFDALQTWEVIRHSMQVGLTELNVTSEPVSAQDVANIFDVRLLTDSPRVDYDVRTVHAEALGATGGYLYTREHALNGIGALRTPGGT